MILHADLIPHEYFHKGIWLSNEQVPWYFFMKKDREFKIPINNNFYETLDENLYPIVKKLHNNKIETTPSCSGHFENKKYYSDIYDQLKHFEKSAKNEVILRDDENDKKYKYRNKNFQLPWDKNEFLDNIIDYQKKGVLGFKDNDKKIYKNLKNDSFIKKHDDGITLILVISETPKDCHKKWKSLYGQLKQIIEK